MSGAAVGAAILAADNTNGGSSNGLSKGPPPPPTGFPGPEVPHCSPSTGLSPLSSQIMKGVNYLKTDMADAQCANDHADGPAHKSGCSMMWSGDGGRIYMCGTFGVKVSCPTAADAVLSMIDYANCKLPTGDGDSYVGGENFVEHDSPLYVTVAKDEGPK